MDYSDGTSADYTWPEPGNANAPRTATTNMRGFLLCRSDAKYRLQLRTQQWEGKGQLTAEINLTTDLPVSSISPSDNPGSHPISMGRIETRGDGKTRMFTYIVDRSPLYCPEPPEGGEPPVGPCPGPFHGFLSDFTDFKGKSTHIEYYNSNENEPRFRFIKSVTDANVNVTEYRPTAFRMSPGYQDSWAITKIIYHDPINGDSFIEQTFTDRRIRITLHEERRCGDPTIPSTRPTTGKPAKDANNPNAITEIDYPDGASETFSL